MKSSGWAVVAIAMVLAAPALAQDAAPRPDPVRVGVDAYERGDYKTAVDNWRAAAATGNADAQFNLGQAYRLGRGVPVDLKIAEDWFRKAALQGHEQAEANYGLALFENGRRPDAVQWLQRAVARGDARAQYILGIMLFNGDSIEKDWVRAYALMVRSSSTGLEVASKVRGQMDQYMPMSDRQQGLALARKYEEEFNRGGTALPPVDAMAGAASQPARPVQKPVVASPPPPAAIRNVAAPAPARDGGWRVQLGAFAEGGNARRLWGQIGGRFPGRQPYYVKAGALTKLLVGPYSSRTEAMRACGSVKPCVAVTR